MAIVSVPEQNLTISDAAQIKDYLAGINIEYEQWETIPLRNDADEQAVLGTYQAQIDEIMQRGGYTSVDLVDVNSATPGLDQMLNKFNCEHWHDEDEVRFTVQGRGLFHIHPAGKPVVAIEVEPGDMIRVPRGTHHWFNLCGTREIKAIRFFQNKTGWTPHYTGTLAEKGYEPVCFGPAYIAPSL